jgi:phage terminase Nu1 subunit (DNA packaging protein)
MTKAAYARRIEVTPQYISKVIKQGKVPVEPDGRIDPEKADAALQALRHRERDAFRKSVIPDGSANGETTSDYRSYQKARTIQAAYKARLTQLEYEILAGSVVKKDDVKTSLFIAARTVRDALLSVPKRIAALLAAETDRAKVEALLRKEILQALTALADEELTKLFGVNRTDNRAAPAAETGEVS